MLQVQWYAIFVAVTSSIFFMDGSEDKDVGAPVPETPAEPASENAPATPEAQGEAPSA